MNSRRWQSGLRWSGGRQSGEGKAGVIFWILVFVVAIVVAKEAIPAKIRDMQLRDHMEELAKLYPRGTGKQFKEEILKRANKLRITIKPENVVVEKNLRRVHMKVEYTATLDFIVTTFDWTFRHELERDIFLI